MHMNMLQISHIMHPRNYSRDTFLCHLKLVCYSLIGSVYFTDWTMTYGLDEDFTDWILRTG